jgi:hypothetical protein
VYCHAYRIYERGVRLPRPQQAVLGELLLERMPQVSGDLSLRARLLDGPSLALPELHSAQVLKLSARGLAVAGIEIVARRSNNKAKADHYHQVWWCLLLPNAVDDVEADALLEPPCSSTGF